MASLDTNKLQPTGGERRRSSLFEIGRMQRERGDSLVYTSNIEVQQAKPKFSSENTYRLEPPRLFPIWRAKKILTEEMHRSIESSTKYDPAQGRALAKEIATHVRLRLREMRYKRYRFVVNIHVGQKENATLFIGSRFVWTEGPDNWASYSMTNSQIFAVGEVYAVSQE